MRYVEAPQTYVGSATTVFLAGGITDCDDWQAAVVRRLADLDAVLLNPRRANFPIHDPDAALEQITWEFQALRQAEIVLFWFDQGPSVQPIALYELGRHAADLDKTLVIGRHPKYLRRQDVDIQLDLARPGLKIHDNLDDLCGAARVIVAEVSR